MGSPTTRSLEYLRAQGYTPGVVEKWNAHARKRQDLYGIIDIVGSRPRQRGPHPILGVQCTSDSNVSSRVKKILASPHLSTLVLAGWTLVVHGWKKVNGKWIVREVTINDIPMTSLSSYGLTASLSPRTSDAPSPTTRPSSSRRGCTPSARGATGRGG